MFITEDETQLGLYFNSWPLPFFGEQLEVGDYLDFKIAKTQFTKYPKDGRACGPEISSGTYLKCIVNHMRRTYLSSKCPMSKIEDN